MFFKTTHILKKKGKEAIFIKIRSGFVTNSSSSSFVMLEIQSPVVYEILKEFEELLIEKIQDDCGFIAFYDDNIIQIHLEETYRYIPENIEEIIDCLAGLLDYNYSNDWEYQYEDDEPLDPSKYPEYIQKLLAQKQEAITSIEFIKAVQGSSGWQGDDESRYDESWYEPDTLETVQSIIMEKHDYNAPSQITDEDFSDYVGDKISIEENIFEFRDGKITKYRTTELQG